MTRKKKKVLAVLGISAALLAVCTISALGAADEAGTITILERMDFPKNNIISYMGRQLGWLLVAGLRFIVNGVESAVYGVSDAVSGFFASTGVVDFLNTKILPIALLLVVFVVLFIGIAYLFKPQDFGTHLRNFAFGLLVFVGLPVLMSGMMDLTMAAVDYLGSSSESVADQTIVSSVTDNLLYDGNNFGDLGDNTNYYQTNNDSDGILNINPTEIIDPGSTANPDVWGNKITQDSYGNQTLEAFENSLISWEILQNGYYRWSFDWLTILVTLGVSAVGLIMMGIKIARLLFELVIQQALAQALGLLDTYSNQRLKKCLQSILGTFVTIFGCFAILQIYVIAMQWIAEIDSLFIRLFCMVAAAMLLIFGPNIFEQLFGQDLGGQRGSLVSTMMGLSAAANLARGGWHLLAGSKGMDGRRHGGLIPTISHTAGRTLGAGGAIGGTVLGGIRGRQTGRIPGGVVAPGTGTATGGSSASSGGGAPSMGGSSGADFSAYEPSDIGSSDYSAGDTDRKVPSLVGTSSENEVVSPAPQSDHQRRVPNHAGSSRSNPLRGDGRTFGGAIKDGLKNRMDRTQVVSMSRRAYDLSYNTAYKWQQRKLNKTEEKK